MSYTCIIDMPNGFVKMHQDGKVEIILNVSNTLTAEELAAVSAISQIVSRLRNGKFINYDFQPPSFENENELVKCEWLRSGNLKIHGATSKPYHHVMDRDAAINQHRTFTCPRYLLVVLPKKKFPLDAEFTKEFPLYSTPGLPGLETSDWRSGLKNSDPSKTTPEPEMRELPNQEPDGGLDEYRQ